MAAKSAGPIVEKAEAVVESGPPKFTKVVLKKGDKIGYPKKGSKGTKRNEGKNASHSSFSRRIIFMDFLHSLTKIFFLIKSRMRNKNSCRLLHWILC